MKLRNQLPASEVASLLAALDGRLDRIGVASRPEIVLRLLNLASDPDAQVADFVKAIRGDAAICGRVLKLSNSAALAQRTAVTTLERACLVLGLERLKSVSLGFYLSRATACGPRDITRQVWGQSVLRGCVAAEVARVVAPGLVHEAYLIGLMMDSGIPLMPRLIGDSYAALWAQTASPGKLFRLECESLEFTHCDVIAALVRRWKFSDVLANPLWMHHARPAESTLADPATRLHRVAYVVGMLELDPHATPTGEEPPGIKPAARILGMSEPEVRGAIERSVREYGVTVGMFADVASALGEGEDLIDLVQRGLVEAVDRSVLQSLERDATVDPVRLTVNGQTLEVGKDADGAMVAHLFDSNGNRLIAHRMVRPDVRPEDLVEGLGLVLATPDDARKLADYVRMLTTRAA
jgi:HD-like signal output (HDOD) protein